MCPTDAPSKFTVAILPLGQISSKQIKLTTGVLEKEFGVNTLVLPSTEIPPQYFNAERNRYNDRFVLKLLFSQLPAEAQRIMGVVAEELEGDDTEPCLGIASLYNRVAIYSAPPLSDQAKNRIEQYALSYHLIVHEFCHTLGIDHCNQPDCAMNDTQCYVKLCADCRRWADRELKVQLGSAEERFSLAEIFSLQNCLPQAITTYREAILLAPHEPLYYRRLSTALIKIKEKKEANKNILRTIELANDKPNLYYSFALLHLEDRLPQAEIFFDKAIAVAKDLKLTQRLIGQAYREIIHDVERASRHYKEYLRLGGDDQDVIDWLVSRNRLVG